MEDNIQRRRILLNDFYKLVMKPNGFTADQYRELMQDKLGQPPLDATYKEIHAAQMDLYKKYRS